MGEYVINVGNSSKFWKISKDSPRKMIITNWGKIGAKARSKEEPYMDESKADANIQKQIKKKMLKGYRLQTSHTNTKKLNEITENLRQQTEILKQKTNKLKANTNKFKQSLKATNVSKPATATKKRKRYPNGTKRNATGECVPKDKTTATKPTVKAETPPSPVKESMPVPSPVKESMPTPSPVKKVTQKRKRCPNGTKRNASGECVPKDRATATKPTVKAVAVLILKK